MDDTRHYREANRRSWDVATDAHNSHKRDQAAFLRGGGSTLYPEEVALLGNLHGKRLLHLQCNAGQDTLSIASMLGATVTGVDISDTAIAFATRLAADSGIPATFHRADVYDWLADATARGDQYDVVFASYGWWVWLPDLRRWVDGVASLLAPGGRVVTIEFHPHLFSLDDDLRLAFPQFGGRRVEIPEGIGDYVAGSALAPSGYEPGVVDFANPHPTHEFGWALADLVGPLLRASFRLDTFEEYPYCNGGRFLPLLIDVGGGRFALPPHLPLAPHMFGIAATRE